MFWTCNYSLNTCILLVANFCKSQQFQRHFICGFLVQNRYLRVAFSVILWTGTVNLIWNGISVPKCFSYIFRLISKFVVHAIYVILGAFACREKRACYLHHALPLVHLSGFPRASTWRPLDGFSWSFILETFMKLYTENPNFTAVGQIYRAL